MPLAIYLTSDNRMKVTGLHDPAYASTHASYYVNDATVTATLYQSDGTTAVSGATSITLSYLTSTDGNYAGSWPSTVTIVDQSTYYVNITISRSGQDTLIRKQCKAQYYEGCDC